MNLYSLLSLKRIHVKTHSHSNLKAHQPLINHTWAMIFAYIIIDTWFLNDLDSVRLLHHLFFVFDSLPMTALCKKPFIHPYRLFFQFPTFWIMQIFSLSRAYLVFRKKNFVRDWRKTSFFRFFVGLILTLGMIKRFLMAWFWWKMDVIENEREKVKG